MRVLYAIGSLFLCLLVGACANSGNSISSVLSVVPYFGEAFNYARFEVAEGSGIKKGQTLTLDLISEFTESKKAEATKLLATEDHKLNDEELKAKRDLSKAEVTFDNVKLKLPPGAHNVYENLCRRDEPEDSANFAGAAGITSLLSIKTFGAKAISYFTDELEDKIDQIRKDSQHTYDTRVTAGKREFDWNSLTCLVVIRKTNKKFLPPGASSNGLVAIFRRDIKSPGSIAESSTFYPIYLLVNNAMAITGESDKPKLAVNFAFALHVVEFSPKSNRPELRLVKPAMNFNGFTVVLGKEIFPCGRAPESTRACNFETLPIPTPVEPAAFSLSVGITETGTGASYAQKAQASVESLKKVLQTGLGALTGGL